MSYESEGIAAIVEGTSSATAVQRSSAGYKAPGQTAFNYTGLVTLSGATATLFLGTLASLNPTTGLAAKVYITDFQATSDFNNTNGNLDIQVQVGGITQIRSSIHNLAPADFINMETQPSANAGGALQLVAAAASTNTHLWYYLAGWTE